jgi:hypothetical protein
MADHVAVEEVGNGVTSVQPTPSPDYSPSVGDVVEFEYAGESGTLTGIVFMHGIGSLYISIGKEDSGSLSVIQARAIKKIGNTDVLGASVHYEDADLLAKAYFAQKPASPVFKVGDVVKVTREGSVSCGHDIGTVGEITGLSEVGSFNVKADGLSLWHSPESLDFAPSTYIADPDKSYAENQAAWIEFYGLKEGSKVKVVREFDRNEGGYSSCAWDNNSVKKSMQGGTYEIKHIRDNNIGLYTDDKDDWWGFPYFALQPA